MKLFRKVRQNLVNKVKLKKYIIYSIGEILLVMIGILLALQVNNWNQQKINQKKEIKALVDLNNEFKLNAKRILKKQKSRIALVPRMENYIRLIATSKADYNSFEDFHSNPFMFGITNPSNGVINTLISSGEISLISNDSLKHYLADWTNQLENLYENEQILWNSGLSFIASTSNEIPNPSQKWDDWNIEKLESASNDLISNIRYRNEIVGFDGCNKIVIEECGTVLNILEKILSLLDNEINTRKE